MTLQILSYLKPFFLLAALFNFWRVRPFIRGSRLDGIFLSLGVFIAVLLAGALQQVARVPEFFDVNVGQINWLFVLEWTAYLVLLVCVVTIFRNYQRSFVTLAEKFFAAVLLIGAFALILQVSHTLVYYFGVDAYTLKSSLIIGMGIFVAVILIPTYLNYFRTRFFFAWCRIGGALLLLTAVNYLQMVVETRSLGPLLILHTEIIRTFSYWLLGVGLYSYFRAHKRVALPKHVYVERETYSEREAIEQIFSYFVESLFALYGSVYGARNQRGLEKRWTSLAARERDAIHMAKGKLENVRGPIELLRQSDRLRKFLSLTQELFVYFCGKPFVQNAFVQVSQELYWGEKDLADTHFFSKLDWAAPLLSGAEEKEVALDELLQGLPIFYGLSHDDIEYLQTHFKRKVFRAGKKIIRQGEKGDLFYLIVSGECAVLKRRGWRQVQVARLQRGDFFGEKALLESTRRTATLKALTPVALYTLQKDDFLQILKTHFDLLQKMEPFQHRIDFLAAIPLFAAFSKMQLLYMASKMRRRQFSAGEWVVRQEEPGKSFFVIEEGDAEVVAAAAAGGEQKRIAELSRGECFGEIALIQPGGRVASVRAVTALDCLELLKEDFDKLFGGCQYNRRKLEKLILRRKEDLEKKLR